MPEPSAFAVRRANHFGFPVSSIEAALPFFVDGLGGHLVREGGFGGEFLSEVTGAPGDVRTAVVELAGVVVELLEFHSGATAARPEPFHPGTAHLALEVDDIVAAIERAKTYGWRPKGVPQTIARGPAAGTRVMYVTSPDGTTIEFMQPPGDS